jgi:hypothetical protein
MVEGDLVDLTLPTLLHALSIDRATAVLRIQHGADQGALYLSAGTLVHALAGRAVGDQAVRQILRWSDGRFRLVREDDAQPRTITHPLAHFLASPNREGDAAAAPQDADAALLKEVLALLARLEQDRARLAEHASPDGGVQGLVALTAMVNVLVAFVGARAGDPNLLPSRVLARLADAQPYTQLLGEDKERITVATAAAVLEHWSGEPDDRRRMLHDLSGALADVLAMYGNAITTLFRSSREREHWRAAFELFATELRAAVQRIV